MRSSLGSVVPNFGRTWRRDDTCSGDIIETRRAGQAITRLDDQGIDKHFIITRLSLGTLFTVMGSSLYVGKGAKLQIVTMYRRGRPRSLQHAVVEKQPPYPQSIRWNHRWNVYLP